MTHRRIAVSMLGTAVLALAFVIPVVFTGVLSGSAPAGAASANHTVKLTGPGTSLAYESKAKAKFTCSSTTGTFTLTASGIQVIGSNHLTPWDTTLTTGHSYWISFWVDGYFAGSPDALALTQNPTTGLYGGTTTGYLDSASECASGNPLLVFGGVSSDTEVPPSGSVPTLGPGEQLANESLELTGHLS